jgi:hypothetical protein
MKIEEPYIIETYTKVITVHKYNPKYGDDRICECGDPYYRHFDTYENMYASGCKYCQCRKFVEKTEISDDNIEWK